MLVNRTNTPYSACVTNARSLLQEARLLYKHRYYARAFFLALTCLEEIGKSHLIVDSLLASISAKEFNAIFKHHRKKIYYLRRIMELISTNPITIDTNLEKGKSELQHYAELRERSLYIECDGKTPNEILRAKQAKSLIRLSEKEFAMMRKREIVRKYLHSKITEQLALSIAPISSESAMG